MPGLSTFPMAPVKRVLSPIEETVTKSSQQDLDPKGPPPQDFGNSQWLAEHCKKHG